MRNALAPHQVGSRTASHHLTIPLARTSGSRRLQVPGSVQRQGAGAARMDGRTGGPRPEDWGGGDGVGAGRASGSRKCSPRSSERKAPQWLELTSKDRGLGARARLGIDSRASFAAGARTVPRSE